MNSEPPPLAEPHLTSPKTTRTGGTIALALAHWFLGLLVSIADLLLADAVIESLVKSGLQEGRTPRIVPVLLCALAIIVLSSVAFLLIRRALSIWNQGR